jgi:branched-chain amino acid transport system substrate-binding protein
MEVIGVLANDPLIPQVYSPGDIGTTPYRWHVIDTPANNWFVEQYVARYGEPPNVISGPAFSAAVAYVRALESTGGDASAAAMIKALETIEFDSVYGPARFRACDHAGLHPYYIIAADNLGSTDGKFSRLVARIEAEDAAIPCGVPGR